MGFTIPLNISLPHPYPFLSSPHITCPSPSLHISTAMLLNHPSSNLQVTAGALPPLPNWPRTCWCLWRPAPLSRRAAGVAAVAAAESGRRPEDPRRWAATRTLGSGRDHGRFIWLRMLKQSYTNLNHVKIDLQGFKCF